VISERNLGVFWENVDYVASFIILLSLLIVYLHKITSLQLLQVLSLVTSQSEGELFEEALARVKRCVGGGASLGNSDDSDSDLKVVAESVSINLRCPVSKKIETLSTGLT